MLYAGINGLAVVIMFAVTTAFAGENSDQANKGRVGFIDDSPESVKLRSGSGDAVAGKDKSELCQGCHGEDGNSVETNIPKLAGQYAKYIAKQLRNYQAGKRSHAIMSAMAATIDDTDLADIAAYFASQNKMKSKGSSSSSRIGKNLFLNGDMERNIVACINCHGVDGKGKAPNIALFPVIGGQHKSYLLKELSKFREGARSNSPGGIMSIITETMSDAELESLADFAASL